MKPSKTKHLYLEENRLRAHMKCPAFFRFGGTVDLPIKAAILEFVYIRLILEMMRDKDFDFNFSLNRTLQLSVNALNLTEYFLKDEIKHVLLKTAEHAKSIFVDYLPAHKYVPVFGPYEYKVNISNSYVDLRISSLLINRFDANLKGLEDKSRALVAVAFSPYTSPRDIENDLIQRIKVMSLADASPLTRSKQTTSVRLHLFGLANEFLHHGLIEWDNKNATGWGKYLTAPIQQIEAKYDYPIVPCLYQCPYKNICEPTPNRKEIKNETGL